MSVSFWSDWKLLRCYKQKQAAKHCVEHDLGDNGDKDEMGDNGGHDINGSLDKHHLIPSD
jgi:hypothetical protein